MFGNFLYFIVALLIYATYPPAEEPNLALQETLFLFVILSLSFSIFVRFTFRKLERMIFRLPPSHLDHRFDATLVRLSVLSIAVYALMIYGLNLPDLFRSLSLFEQFPTAEALVFLSLFVAYMSVVWAFAYPSYQAINGTDLSRRQYVVSNISFSIPVLLPWLVLSGVSDLLRALPYELPRRILETPEGEIAYFLVFLTLVAVGGPVLVQKFWRCRPLEPGPVRERIEKLCRRADVSYSDILRWPLFGGRMITAGVMGLVGRFRYILVTSGLMRHLDPEEIDAVIAHEIGHVKRRHLLFYLFFFVGYLLLAYSSFELIVFLILYSEPVYRLIQWSGANGAAVSSTIFSLLIIVLFLVYFRYIFGYFMRNFEREADIYIYELFQSAAPLVSTFQKIAMASGKAPDKPNWHHFSITERIEYLLHCEKDRRWIDRHHRKVRWSIAVYAAAVLLIGAFGYHFNYGGAGRQWSARVLERIVVREVQRSPGDPNLHRLLGDLYYASSRYAEAIDAYQRALRLRPNDPLALNNLAWLFATSPIPEFRRPEAALGLAQQAAALDPSAHVLDTLAESYFVNGRFDEALDAARSALDKAWRDRSYYETQLERFEKAAAGEMVPPRKEHS